MTEGDLTLGDEHPNPACCFVSIPRLSVSGSSRVSSLEDAFGSQLPLPQEATATQVQPPLDPCSPTHAHGHFQTHLGQESPPESKPSTFPSPPPRQPLICDVKTHRSQGSRFKMTFICRSEKKKGDQRV